MSTKPSGGESTLSAWMNGAVGASPWLSCALLVTITGALASQGYDALPLTLGVAGALFVSTITTPPRAPSSNPTSLADQLDLHDTAPMVRRSADVVLFLGAAGLVGAEIASLTTPLAFLTQAPSLAFAASVGIAILGIASARWTRTGMPSHSAALIASAAFFVIIGSCLYALSFSTGSSPTVLLPVVSDITALEQILLDKRLADPAVFKPHAAPFLRVDMLNASAIIVLVCLGLAMLNPMARTSSPKKKSTHAITTTILVTLVLMALPAFAAVVKRALLAAFAGGLSAANVPSWIVNAMGAGAAQLCGSADGTPAVIMKACGKGVGPSGWMRWQELALSPDAMAMAALSTLGQSAYLQVAFVAAGALALIATGNRLATGVSGIPTGSGVSSSQVMKYGALLLGSVAVGFAMIGDAATLFVWSASLVAAALGPALLAYHAGAKPHPRWVVLAIAIGAATTLIPMGATRFFPTQTFAATASLSSASPNVMRKFAALNNGLANASPGSGLIALESQLARLSRDNMSWMGIRPLAVGIFGLGLSALIIMLASMAASISRLRRTLNDR